jgi:hypothetical protein
MIMGVLAVYYYLLRTPGPTHSPTHHVSWHKKFMAMCYTVKDVGTLARKNLKEKNYLCI